MRSFFIPAFLLVFACGFTAAQTSTTPKPTETVAPAAQANAASLSATGLPSEAAVDSFMQQTFGYEPGMSWKVSSIKPAPAPGLAQVDVILASPHGQQASRFYVTADGTHAVVGEIIPFGPRPFDAIKNSLEKGITGPSRGPKNSAVTVVEFGDLQCPVCKAAQPAIDGLIAAEPNARFVFQNFPLEMHNWAAKGAAYADCVAQASEDAFWKFLAKTYETQSDITAENADEKLTAIADGAGLKGSDIAACASTPVTKAHVEASIALGKSAGVTGTPTLFINGRSIGNVPQVPAATLKELVDFAAKDAK
ncbi:MAG: thioredoxin domain-containing protein [Candidatus Sulfotelmatobacter sp.]